MALFFVVHFQYTRLRATSQSTAENWPNCLPNTSPRAHLTLSNAEVWEVARDPSHNWLTLTSSCLVWPRTLITNTVPDLLVRPEAVTLTRRRPRPLPPSEDSNLCPKMTRLVSWIIIAIWTVCSFFKRI